MRKLGIVMFVFLSVMMVGSSLAHAGGGLPVSGSWGIFRCPANCNDGNPCTQDRCNWGRCVHLGVGDGTTCDDGDACTKNDTCQSGRCVPQSTLDCNDGNPCTTDSCVEGTTNDCQHETMEDGTRIAHEGIGRPNDGIEGACFEGSIHQSCDDDYACASLNDNPCVNFTCEVNEQDCANSVCGGYLYCMPHRLADGESCGSNHSCQASACQPKIAVLLSATTPDGPAARSERTQALSFMVVNNSPTDSLTYRLLFRVETSCPFANTALLMSHAGMGDSYSTDRFDPVAPNVYSINLGPNIRLMTAAGEVARYDVSVRTTDCQRDSWMRLSLVSVDFIHPDDNHLYYDMRTYTVPGVTGGSLLFE